MLTLILLILLGVALAFVFVNRKKDEEKAKMGIIAIVLGIIVVAGLHLHRQSRPSAAAFYDPTRDREMAAVFVQRFIEHAEGRSVVMIGDTDERNIFMRERLDVFQRELEQADFRILAVVGARQPIELEEGLFAADEVMDMAAIEYALNNHPEAEVLISIAGLPFAGWERVIPRLRTKEFYVIDENAFFDWRPLMRQNVINGIIIPSMDPSFADTSGTAEDIFNRRYMFVTMENIQEVAELMEIF